MTTRRDALLDDFDYEDDGCYVAPHCLECPLPICRYDVRGGVRAIRNMERDAAIRTEYTGDNVEAIAARFGVSRRTVFRVLAS